MGVRINITKEHIDTAVKMEPEACMVHDAIASQLQKPGLTIAVEYEKVIFKMGKRQLSVRIPSDIGDKIRGWDNDHETDPFDFDLNLPMDWEERLTRPVTPRVKAS